MRVVSVAQMRAMERLTFAAGVGEQELQRRAGSAVARAIGALPTPAGRNREVVALVGSGNNGRDAWVAAEALLRDGWTASLYLTPGHSLEEPDLRGFLQAGGRLLGHSDRNSALAVESALASVVVAIDGLLGIGAHGAPRPPLDAIIETLNRVGQHRAATAQGGFWTVAVDVPSGLDADSGVATGQAVHANLTVVLGGAKQGLLSPAAVEHTGRLVFADIGVIDGASDAAEVVDESFVRGLIAARSPAAHKGTFGRLLVIAGSPRYVGAAHLATAAAARAGAGIVTLAAPTWLRDILAPGLPEATYLVLPDGGPSQDALQSAELIAQEIDLYSALVVGPGLSTEGQTHQLVEAVLRAAAEHEKAVVVDADALNVLAGCADWPRWIGKRAILTPHLGELRRLAPNEDVLSSEPWELARKLSGDWGVTLLVKGPFTSIGSGPRAWVHPRPNPALATAGTGDVLSGIIGGLLARGLAPGPAACVGVWVHGEAGAKAAVGHEAGGLLASDLLPHISPAMEAALPARA